MVNSYCIGTKLSVLLKKTSQSSFKFGPYNSAPTSAGLALHSLQSHSPSGISSSSKGGSLQRNRVTNTHKILLCHIEGSVDESIKMFLFIGNQLHMSLKKAALLKHR